MNIWENAIITQKGLALQSKLIQGKTLKITRAVAGTGYVSPVLLVQQTAISGIKQELIFKEFSYPEEGKCSLVAFLTNEGLATGYTATQVGIYAEDPDEGEILYFINQATSGKGTDVPSETEMPGYQAEWTFYFQYGQADGITVTVDPANTINELEAQELIDAALVPVMKEIEKGARRYCLVGTNANAATGWFKVASQTMNSHSDTNALFAVTCTYGNYFSGIFSLRLRADETKINARTAAWFARDGFEESDVRIAIEGMTWTLYVRKTHGQYSRIMFEVLSESSINNGDSGITLHHSTEPETTEPVASLVSTDAMVTIPEFDAAINERNLKTYTNATQLGCTAASTPAEIYNALPGNSMFIEAVGNLTNSAWNFPSDFYMLVIIKRVHSRGKTFILGKNQAHGVYFSEVDDNGAPTGEWIRLAIQSEVDTKMPKANFKFDASTGTLDITL